jgi:hypothetical protein
MLHQTSIFLPQPLNVSLVTSTAKTFTELPKMPMFVAGYLFDLRHHSRIDAQAPN